MTSCIRKKKKSKLFINDNKKREPERQEPGVRQGIFDTHVL